LASVLVVEDDKPLLQAMVEILEMAGYEVRPAESGDIAFDVLKDWPPDIIVTDVIMPPGINGIALADAVRVHPKWKHIPILFVSASTTLQHEGRILEIERSEFLRKPFAADELQEAVANLLETD
jgi:CheY-like chemotaxis protein